VQPISSIISKAFILINLFETGRPVTVRDVMKHLGVSKCQAKRWIDEISVYMPIYEYNTPDAPVSWQNPTRYILNKN
jgi:hypothetical protein